MTDTQKEDRKILLIEQVDDDESLQMALRDKFSLEGFDVVQAKDGQEGLVLALRNHPDIILLDILMPEMDGIAMMKKVREEGEWGKKVPIILLTNLTADDAISQACAEYEPAYYLIKSDYTMGELIEKIKERLSRTY